MEQKKRRGRPQGTTLEGDITLLATVADIMLRQPSLTPTAAIKKVVPEWTDTIVRRLLGKWRKQHETLLAEAHKRQEVASSRPTAAGSPIRTGMFNNLADAATMREPIDFSNLRLAREMENNPVMKLHREINDSPEVRFIQEVLNSPAFKVAQEQARILRSLGL